MEELESIIILSSKNVINFRNYISIKYADSTPKEKAKILADAIEKTIDERIPKVEKSLKTNLRDNIIKTMVNRGSLEINSADILLECLNLKFDVDVNEDAALSALSSWFNKVTSKNIEKENIKRFIKSVYDLDVKDLKINKEEITSGVLENTIQLKYSNSTDDISDLYFESNKLSEESEIPEAYQIEHLENRSEDGLALHTICKSNLIFIDKVKRLNIKNIAIGVSLIILIIVLKINTFGNNYIAEIKTDNTKNALQSIRQDFFTLKVSEKQSQSLEALLLKNYRGLLEETEIKSADKIELNFKNVKKTIMKATAYDLSIECCGKPRNHPLYGITSSGAKATKGRTVAVDSSVIPLGSKLYIQFPKSFSSLDGIYIAEDTGSKVKGNIIDIFLGEDKIGESIVHEKADNFGIQMVDVFFIG